MSFFQCRPRRFAFLNRCSAACLVKNVEKSNKFLGLLLSNIRKVKAKTFTYRPYCFWFVFRTGIFRVHLHNQVKVAHSVHSRERARRSSALQSSSLKYSKLSWPRFTVLYAMSIARADLDRTHRHARSVLDRYGPDQLVLGWRREVEPSRRRLVRVARARKLGIETSHTSSSPKVKTLMITDPDGNDIAFAQTLDKTMAR